MKRSLFLLLIITFLFLGCSINKQPLFLRVENIELIETNSNFITVEANAYFNNPNDVGGTLKSDEINVLVNDIEVANVSSEDFKVPAKKEFSIPLRVTINTNKILKAKNNNVLESLLKSVLNKSIKIQYKGDIVYKTFGFSYTYAIDETEHVKLKF